jgi:hypothetical protein
MTAFEKRLSEVEQKLAAAEQRLGELERKNAAWESRRAKILPPEIYEDPNVLELAADYAKTAVEGWRKCIRANGIALEQAKFIDAERKALQLLEDKARAEKFSEAAELAAVIKYFQKWGEMPAGYELVENDFESPPTSLQRWELPPGETKQ